MNKRQILIILNCFFHIFIAQAQVHTRTVCQLPAVLTESSGLYVPAPDSIWSHNDSGNAPELYLTDTTGKLNRTVQVSGTSNVDWEELAADPQGNLYIGDFGNNNNNRRDLVIYKVPNFRALRTNTVTPQAIHFRYEDQMAFPPLQSNYVYDAEAMLVFEDSIFIATKDYHAVPYKGITRIYRIPNIEGTHVATFVTQVVTDPSDKNAGGITGMTISADRKQVILISHHKIYLAENFSDRSFWSVPWKSTTFITEGTKEAVAFKDPCQLYLTEDNGGKSASNLYTLDLCKWRTALNGNAIFGYCYPNPSISGENVTVFFKKTLNVAAVLYLYDMLGREIAQLNIEKGVDNITIPGALLKGEPVSIAYFKGIGSGVKIVHFN